MAPPPKPPERGDSSGGYTTTVTVVHPDGTTTTVPIAGDSSYYGVQVGADGTAAQTTQTQDSPAVTPRR